MKRTALVIGAAQAVLFSVPFFAWKAAWAAFFLPAERRKGGGVRLTRGNRPLYTIQNMRGCAHEPPAGLKAGRIRWPGWHSDYNHH